MLLYHFSDGEFKQGELMTIGNYGNYVSKSSNTVQQFEKLMEIERKRIAPQLPSRLNCIFAFNQQYADGFKTDRKYLYELDVPDDSIICERNYNVSTYFWNLCHSNDLQKIKSEIDLMGDYWKNDGDYMTSEFEMIPYEKEFLISTPALIKRVI